MDVLNRSAFVIRIPSDVQTAVGDAQLQIRRKAGADLVRWTPATELVITLVSLGEISPSQVAQIAASAGAIVARYPAVSISIEGLGGSPTNLQPRFLWLGLGGDVEALERLTGDLERMVGPIVSGHESRSFQAHLPIGRLKQESESNRSALGRAVRVAGIAAVGSFHAATVELVRTATTTAGPTFVTVQSFPLGA